MPEIPVTDVTSLSDEWVQRVPSGTAGEPARDDRFYDVRIMAPGISGLGARIELDGVPMKGVRSYAVRVGLNDASEVTVTFIAGSVNREDAGVQDPARPA